ncbi:hypothetical protein AMTR_s00068p00166340 [Amborella trichopoda]|uniref:BHLH domain-containing protein n=2 Tax=Amborella trichopoda TaxID=13333 RepID=U5D4F2_AMBTC|nr:hypothetical protein AMTR_s00068p00166340 [Amborella trichopoda]
MEHQGSAKPERKTIEKLRRMNMKALFSKLMALTPQQSSKEAISMPDRLGEVIEYIKNFEKNIEVLKEERDMLKKKGVKIEEEEGVGVRKNSYLPIIKVQALGSSVEVSIVVEVCSSDRFRIHDVVLALQEEGAEIVNANFNTMDDKMIAVLHCQVSDYRVGFDTGRVYEKLRTLVQRSL